MKVLHIIGAIHCCSLSPNLFKIFIEEIMLKEETRIYKNKNSEENINEILFSCTKKYQG